TDGTASRADSTINCAPMAKRCSGSSVDSSTTTSPRTPCGRTMRPTVSSIGSVRVDDLDPDASTADRAHHLPQRLGRAAVTPDHRAEVLRVDAHLQAPTATAFDQPHPDVVRVVDDALDEVLKGRFEGHVRPALGAR